MLALHGFAASNYYNLVKHVLLYKEIPFQENLVYGGSERLLTISPAGKVPVITTPEGLNICESSVICDYLEETYLEKPLYPGSSTKRALVRQTMKIAELYLELPSRRLLPFALSGTQAPEALTQEVRKALERGIAALSRLGQFSPWIAGEQFSMADIYVYHVNTVVSSMGHNQLNWDVLEQIPSMKAWSIAMSQSDIAQKVEAERLANMPDFIQKLKAQY